MKKNCLECGKEFETDKPQRVFCCNAHGTLYRNRKARAKAKRETKICAFDGCENTFEVPAGSKKQRYCNDTECKKIRAKAIKKQTDAKRRQDTLNSSECILDSDGKIPAYYLRRGRVSGTGCRSGAAISGGMV